MKSTKYLFNKSRMDYEPHITILATKRIDDGLKLLKELSREKKDIDRYQAVEKAIKLWREILEEE